MCGIAGLLELTGRQLQGESDVSAMAQTMIHRGPDDGGTFSKGPISLGFRRLSIIDLSAAGHQPLGIEDGKCWIVFNGEAYNYRDLRALLEEKGASFRSNSDTEVVLQAYRHYGVEFLKYIRGMFALAIWDDAKQTLLLARDRVGKKPLHYFSDGKRFAFASEIKAILALPFVSRDLDWSALEEYFCFGYIGAPRTIYNAIRKVRPGHYISIHKGAISEHSYWELSPNPDAAKYDLEEAKREVKTRLAEAVRIRMVSDVPLGAFLSGGVDSSLVVALMAEQSSKPVKTFSIGFRENAFDETRHARTVADRFSTDHTEVIVSMNHADLVHGILSDFDEPFGDSSALPTYVVSHTTRQSVTVALSGDGGDELFAGYNLYADILRHDYGLPGSALFRPLARRLGWLVPESMRGGRRLRQWGQSSPQDLFVHQYTVFDTHARRSLFSPECIKRFEGPPPEERKRSLFHRTKDFSLIRQLQYNDVHHYLPDDILVKVDRMSMLTSLEVRSPLLDHQVMEFSFGVRPEFHVHNGQYKYLLKSILCDYFPREFVSRPKQGFAIPMRSWLREDLGDVFREFVLTDRMRKTGFFNMKRVDEMFRMHREGKRDYSNSLWLLLAFGVWADGSLR